MIRQLPNEIIERIEILEDYHIKLFRKDYDNFESFLGGFDYRRHFEETTRLSATVRWKSYFNDVNYWYIWKEDDILKCSKRNNFKENEELPYEAFIKPDEFPEYYI